MNVFKYPDCDCEFQMVGVNKVLFTPKFEHIPHNCPKTWSLIQTGNTRGMFQIESGLGRQLSKRLKPENIQHLAALTSIMRPGVMEALIDGKSVTAHYIDRKNGIDTVRYFHPALEPILKNTYGCLIYQEQAIRIAADIAGYSLAEADNLRKAIGKKKPEIMAENKTKFIEMATTLGIVTHTEAEEIFSWIEKSQRYSFNASHAFSYAADCYISAYAKAHFPRVFFTSYLSYAKDKSAKKNEEIKELVNSARSMAIEIFPPDIRKKNENFRLIDKIIYFGIGNIKGIGESVVKKVSEVLARVEQLKGPIDNMTWSQVLTYFLSAINSKAVEGLILSGALSFLKVSRNKMLFEYKQFSELTEKEMNYVAENISGPYNTDTIADALDLLIKSPVGRKGGVANEKRRTIIVGLKNAIMRPPYSLTDHPEWVAGTEEAVLHVALTANKVDGCTEAAAANCSCAEFADKKGGYILLAVELKKVRENTVKKGKSAGQQMAFAVGEDSSGIVDNIVVFPDAWPKCKPMMYVGNTVLVGGNKNKDSLVVDNVYQI